MQNRQFPRNCKAVRVTRLRVNPNVAFITRGLTPKGVTLTKSLELSSFCRVMNHSACGQKRT